MEAFILMILTLIFIQILLIVHFLMELRKDFLEFKEQFKNMQK